MSEPTIGCRDECGKKVTFEEASQTAWTYLDIQKRWRCPECSRALTQANQPTKEEAK